MHFKIITDIPEKIYNGLIIYYNVKIPFMGATNWISEIKHVEEPYQFVDEQRMGPYKWWYHQHQLRETSQGIEVIDRVFYQLPFGMLGRIAHKIFVKRQLNRIFSHRNKMFIELLEK
jgi:ligand-binding SRPBCC domain-containing protein